MMSVSDDEMLHNIRQTTASKMRFADEARPSDAAQNTTTPSTTKTDTTNVTITSSTDDLFTDSFYFASSKVFSYTLMASLIFKDTIHKELGDCLITDKDDRCRKNSAYMQSHWEDLHVKNGCNCVNDRIAIPNSIKDAYIEASHATYPGSWDLTDIAIHAWWPYLHRDLLSKTTKRNPGIIIVTNLKHIIPTSELAPLKLYKLSNEEVPIDFGGAILTRKTKKLNSLHVWTVFQKFPLAEIVDRANAHNVLKVLQDYVLLHGIPCSIGLDQAKCQIGLRVKSFCNHNNTQLFEAPIHDHKAVERLSYYWKAKSNIACIKTAARENLYFQSSI